MFTTLLILLILLCKRSSSANGHNLEFRPQAPNLVTLDVRHNKQQHNKVLFSNFHVIKLVHLRNSCTDSPCSELVCDTGFHLNGYSLEFHTKTRNFEPPSTA